MKTEDLIPAQEICIKYKVETTFIKSLNESGLITLVTINKTEYLHCDHVAEFEKLRRLHYDLQINLEGIEAIYHLLQQVEELHEHNKMLKNRLGLYE